MDQIPQQHWLCIAELASLEDQLNLDDQHFSSQILQIANK